MTLDTDLSSAFLYVQDAQRYTVNLKNDQGCSSSSSSTWDRMDRIANMWASGFDNLLTAKHADVLVDRLACEAALGASRSHGVLEWGASLREFGGNGNCMCGTGAERYLHALL